MLLAFIAVGISLERPLQALISLAIKTEPGLQRPPLIFCALATPIHAVTAVAVVAHIGPAIGAVANFCAIAPCGAEELIAATNTHQSTLGILGLFGDDVDDAVHRIGTPQCATRAADNLDAIHIFQKRILHIPEHTTIGR